MAPYVETVCTPAGREAFTLLIDAMLTDVKAGGDRDTWITLTDYMNGRGIEGHLAHPWEKAARPIRKHSYYRVKHGQVKANEQSCVV